MKRKILAARGFKRAAEKYADSLNDSIFENSNMYYATVDTKRKLVVICDKHTDSVVTEIRLKTVPIDVTNSEYRLATPKEISKGIGLYVRDKHSSSTEKYIPEAEETTSIANRYRR